MKLTGPFEEPDWDRIRELANSELRGLPERQFRQEYTRRVSSGHLLAREYLRSEVGLVPKTSDLLEANALVFGGVYDFAGTERRVELLVGPVMPAPPAREVPLLLSELDHKAKEMFARPGLEARFEAIAKFHAELKRIQIFRDGNGRTASCVLEDQIQKSIGREKEIVIDGEEYRKALQRAMWYHKSRESVEDLKHLLIDAAGMRRELDLEKKRTR